MSYYNVHMHCISISMGVRDQFRLGGGGGGLRSIARTFSPVLTQKSSGLPEYYIIFSQIWLFEKFQPPPPASYA